MSDNLTILKAGMERAALAHRRYPDMPLVLALQCFDSDRRHAGLGALDERKRSGRGEVRNRKRMSLEDGRILYDMVIDRPERRRWPTMPEPRPLSGVTSESTVTLELVPATLERRCLPVTWRMLSSQRDRTYIAHELRRARRDMRKRRAP